MNSKILVLTFFESPRESVLNTLHPSGLNADFFPAAVLRQGPVWRSARQELGIVSFLEEHFKVIQEELLRILEAFRESKNQNPKSKYGCRLSFSDYMFNVISMYDSWSRCTLDEAGYDKLNLLMCLANLVFCSGCSKS